VPAVQALGATGTLTDTFVVTSGDGSQTQTITVTIHGTNDVPGDLGRGDGFGDGRQSGDRDWHADLGRCRHRAEQHVPGGDGAGLGGAWHLHGDGRRLWT